MKHTHPTSHVNRRIEITLSALLATLLATGTTARAAEGTKIPWDLKTLSKPPATQPAEKLQEPGLTALFYDGQPWKGRPTRVFAWYGKPETRPGEKVPAMVLVHGGGGTAFEEWVRLWVQRGYAAIAMDTCGHIGHQRQRTRHEYGGPDGWGGFAQVDDRTEDQWTYHAVADVILAHSLIRSFPEVDPNRIGLTGISWGGYLTCITAGVDDRFCFAVPVYGCGFLGENSAWLKQFEQMGKEKSTKWLDLWDPSRYLRDVHIPIMWVTGTNDGAYPLDSVKKSYRLVTGPRSLCIRIRMPHGHHGPGENPKEIQIMADHMLKKKTPLPKITGQGRKDKQAWTTFDSPLPITEATLCFTKDTGNWNDRKWESIPATLDEKSDRAQAMLPDGTTGYYFNLKDNRDCIVSSEHQEVSDTEDK